jgi:hypothetical protein
MRQGMCGACRNRDTELLEESDDTSSYFEGRKVPKASLNGLIASERLSKVQISCPFPIFLPTVFYLVAAKDVGRTSRPLVVLE